MNHEHYLVNAAQVAFVGALCLHVRELRPLLQEHLRQNSGEVLPDMFMTDAAAWLVERVREHGTTDGPSRAMLEFADKTFGKDDPNIDELLSVSFLVAITHVGVLESTLIEMLGSRLRSEMASIKAWTPPNS